MLKFIKDQLDNLKIGMTHLKFNLMPLSQTKIKKSQL